MLTDEQKKLIRQCVSLSQVKRVASLRDANYTEAIEYFAKEKASAVPVKGGNYPPGTKK